MNGKIMSEENEKVIKVTPEETEKSINTNQESATFLVIGDKAYTSEIIEEYNRNAEAKTENFNTNAENKIASYNSNAADRTTAFNNNYNDKMAAFNSNASKKTEEFDSHVLMQTNTFNNNAASTIANYNSNAEQKTYEFNQNALSYQEGIDANKKHIINVSNELERVKNDVLETGTDTDTYIHLEDSAMAEYQELSVDGVCEQDIINLVDGYIESVSNSYRYNYIDTGVIPTKDTAIEIKINIPSDSPKSYDRILGNMYPYFFIGRDGSATNIIKIVKGNGQLNYLHTFEYDKDFTIKVDTNGLYIDGELVSSYDVGGNYKTMTIWLFSCNYGDRDGAFKLYYCNIWENGELIKSFKPAYSNKYGGCLFEEVNNEIYYNKGNTKLLAQNISQDVFSPNPSYPQEIKTIEGSLKITSCNKNLFDINSYNADDFISVNKNGLNSIVNFEGITDNKITFKADGDNQCSVYTKVKNLKANTTYTIRANIEGYNSSNELVTSVLDQYCSVHEDVKTDNVSYSDKNNIRYYKNDGVKIKSSCTSNSITFTTTTKYRDVYVNFHIWGSKITKVILSNIQLEENTQATPFEQHLETLIEANLPEGEFAGYINDTYRDRFKVEYNKEDGQYHLKLYKNIGKVVLDGSQETTMRNSQGTIFEISINHTFKRPSQNYVKGEIQCSHFTTLKYYENSINDLFGAKNGIAIPAVDEKNTFYFGTTKISDTMTLDEFKNWLTNNPVTVYYVLATPYVLDLGIVDMPITYNEVTNLFTDSDLMPTINAKYYRNFITTIQNLQVNEKVLKQELVDINNRLSALESASTSVTSESEVTE